MAITHQSTGSSVAAGPSTTSSGGMGRGGVAGNMGGSDTTDTITKSTEVSALEVGQTVQVMGTTSGSMVTAQRIVS